MDKQKLVKKLKEFIEKNKLKNSKVETDLGLPKNSLSNFLSEKKALPDKWINPIMKYALGDLADKVTTADKIPEPQPKDFHTEENIEIVKETWITDIENYCEKESITPSDLIETHKSRNKPQKVKKGTNASKSEETTVLAGKDNTVSRSNWFQDYRKNKTGIK